MKKARVKDTVRTIANTFGHPTLEQLKPAFYTLLGFDSLKEPWSDQSAKLEMNGKTNKTSTFPIELTN